jgi:hypothetical protein
MKPINLPRRIHVRLVKQKKLQADAEKTVFFCDPVLVLDGKKPSENHRKMVI